jgi:hypothetical protein
MLWKIALYLALAWGILCTVLTVTYFTRVGIDALRKRLKGASSSQPLIVPVEETPLLTMQPNHRRPG